MKTKKSLPPNGLIDYCHGFARIDVLENIQGDLHEIYQSAPHGRSTERQGYGSFGDVLGLLGPWLNQKVGKAAVS